MLLLRKLGARKVSEHFHFGTIQLSGLFSGQEKAEERAQGLDDSELPGSPPPPGLPLGQVLRGGENCVLLEQAARG